MDRKSWKRLLCLALCLCLTAGAWAAGKTPAKPLGGYVLDQAGVLERETVSRINDRDQDIIKATGGVIAVVAVDYLNGMDIADYAVTLFNDWGIGDKDRDNGLLILLAIREDDYYLLQGAGLQKALPSSTLDSYAWDYLESDFAAGDYDAGVNKLFDALYQWYEDYYLGYAAPSGGMAQAAQSQSSGALGGLGWLVALAVIILLLVVLTAAGSRRRRRYYYGGIYYPASPAFFGRRRSRAPRPPRPPRTPGNPAGNIFHGDHTGYSSGFGGGMSRGGGAARRSSGSSFGGGSHRSSGSSFGGGSHRSSGGGFGGGMSRGGGAGRRH